MIFFKKVFKSVINVSVSSFKQQFAFKSQFRSFIKCILSVKHFLSSDTKTVYIKYETQKNK